LPALSAAAQRILDRTGIPPVGLGTSGRVGEAGMAAILNAIEIGYRHIDSAQNYGSEGPMGEAVRRSGLPRDAFFLTTKVGDARLDRASFLPSVEKSLESIGVDQIDLLLVHWPLKDNAVPFASYMEDLAEAKARGWTRLIGVSNFPIARLDEAARVLGPGALATDQMELHPYLQNPKLTAYARAHGLTLTAYRPLAHGRVAGDRVLREIGVRHGVPAATVALAFLIAEGHVVIPASTNPARLKDNLRAQAIALADEEVSRIRALDRGERLINPDKAPVWDD
jgi:2,5-diketo-D-gluconate reductase B